MSTNDDSDKKELVIDFFLSRTCDAPPRKRSDDTLPHVHEYARILLAALLGVPPRKLEVVNDVRVWKQSHGIDLQVDTGTDRGNYALLIETKAYSHLRDNQPERLKRSFSDYYGGKRITPCFAVVVLQEMVPDEMTNACDQNGYRPFSLENLREKPGDRRPSRIDRKRPVRRIPIRHMALIRTASPETPPPYSPYPSLRAEPSRVPA